MKNHLNKHERIELRKQEIGSKHQRKLQKYSDNFNEIFTFFLQSYRKGLLTFCGAIVNVDFDLDGPEGKHTFRKYDNGDYQMGKPIVSCHPNIVKAVIVGKKSWGLFLDQWSDAIVECTFFQRDIEQDFKDNGIIIPLSLLKDFDNRIYQKRLKKHGLIA